MFRLAETSEFQPSAPLAHSFREAFVGHGHFFIFGPSFEP